MTEVVPAIIPSSFDDLKEKLGKVKGLVSNVQIDIMDGKYAPSKSWPFSVSKVGQTEELENNISREFRLGFELDMMVENPEIYIDAWSSFGVHTFLIHFGSTNNLGDTITTIRDKGKGIGIAVLPSTNLDEIEPFINEVDSIQFMGNDKIGFHGVDLDENVLEKIKDLRNRHKELIISIDIGVNFDTAPKLVSAGVSKLVSGSAIYNHSDISEAIQKLSLA